MHRPTIRKAPPPILAWIFTVMAAASWSFHLLALAGDVWESSGRIVLPAWPPTTGTDTSFTDRPRASDTNVLARTTSSLRHRERARVLMRGNGAVPAR